MLYIYIKDFNTVDDFAYYNVFISFYYYSELIRKKLHRTDVFFFVIENKVFGTSDALGIVPIMLKYYHFFFILLLLVSR